MREHEQGLPEGQPATSREAKFDLSLSPDDWELIHESLDEYLRIYTEANYTWWDPDDKRPSRLQALLEKLRLRPRIQGEDEPADKP